MAARKTGRSKALATAQSGGVMLPQHLQDKYAAHVTRAKATTRNAGWPWISTQGSTPIMRLNNVPIGGEEGELDAIVLGANRANMYWPKDFQSGQFAPATCYAVASLDWAVEDLDEKLAPPPDLAGKQAERCAKCHWDAFGTATRGRGKACKNTVRLALIPSDAGDYSKADGCMLSLPATSLRAWTAHAAPYLAMGAPVFCVQTRIRKVPNERDQGFVFSFESRGFLSDEAILDQLAARADGDARAALEQAPPSAGDASAPTGTSKAPRRKKKVVRKK